MHLFFLDYNNNISSTRQAFPRMSPPLTLLQMATTAYGVSPWLIGLIETMVAGTDYTLAQLSEKVISKKTYGLPLAYTQLFVNEIDPQVSHAHAARVLPDQSH